MQQEDRIEEEPTLEGAVLPWLIAAVVVVVLSVAGFLALGQTYERMSDFDTAGLRWAYERRDDVQSTIFAAITWGGDVTGMTLQALIFLGLILWRRPSDWRWWVLLVILVLPLGFLVSSLLKNAYGRARPTLFDSPYFHATYAYPSGHAFAAIGFYGALAYMAYQKLRRRSAYWLAVLAALLLTVIVSFTRVYFSVHWPTDVIGGALGGLGWLILCIALVETVRRRTARHTLVRAMEAKASPPS